MSVIPVINPHTLNTSEVDNPRCNCIISFQDQVSNIRQRDWLIWTILATTFIFPWCILLFSFTDDGMDNPWCTSAWEATQALEILGLLSLFIAVVMVSLQMFKFRDRRIPKLAGISCCFIGGILVYTWLPFEIRLNTKTNNKANLF
jgi:hypothetical protein